MGWDLQLFFVGLWFKLTQKVFSLSILYIYVCIYIYMGSWIWNLTKMPRFLPKRLISRNFTPQRSQTEMSRKRRRPKCKGHLDHTFRAAEQDFGSLFWAWRILIFHWSLFLKRQGLRGQPLQRYYNFPNKYSIQNIHYVIIYDIPTQLRESSWHEDGFRCQ